MGTMPMRQSEMMLGSLSSWPRRTRPTTGRIPAVLEVVGEGLGMCAPMVAQFRLSS